MAVAGPLLLGAAAVAAGRGFAPAVAVALAGAIAVVVAAWVSAASVVAGAPLVLAAALEGLENGLTMAFRPENMGPGKGGGSGLCMAAKGFGDLAICTMADGAIASGLLMVIIA